jgi:hypothetical protein
LLAREREAEVQRIPDRFIFMKVGEHAGESFKDILERKQRELEAAGRIFWGYGGSTCHPRTQVQPFAKQIVEQHGQIHMLLQPMNSKADPDLVPATEFSVDGIEWKELPSGVCVTGSRYAMVMGEIQADEFELPLHEYVVGHGRSEGRAASKYIQGRVDKACLTRADAQGAAIEAKSVAIEYKAALIEPYAVFLR